MARRRMVILQGARLNSRRLPRKLLRSVQHGQTLMARGLEFLSEVSKRSGVPFAVAIPEADRELRECVEPGTKIYTSQDVEDWEGAFGGFREELLQDYDWVLDGNFLCWPFLKYSTAVKLVGMLEGATEPFVTVSSHRGVIYAESQIAPRPQVIFGAGQTANGLTNPEYLTPNHLAYGYPAYMLGNEAELAEARPQSIYLTSVEKIDIDTYEDLDLAQIVGRCIFTR
jgi:hypothetical protein